MDDKRARTLQALSAFIDKQRTLLTKTQADIDRLYQLRSKAVAQDEEFADNLSEELDDSAFKLSELDEAVVSPPEGIEWSVFAKHDPSPLQALAAKVKLQQQQPPQPPLTTTPTLSDFQKQIREAKSNILDPVFSTWNFSFNPVLESANDDPPSVDPAALKKAKEREKIKELKKHKIMPSGLTLTPSGPRTRGPGGVFIRRDQVDESGDVDISGIDNNESSTPVVPTPSTPLPETSVLPRRSPSVDKSSRMRKSFSKASTPLSVSAAPPSSPLTPRRKASRTMTASSCSTEDTVMVDVDSRSTPSTAFPPTPDSLPLPDPDVELDNEDPEVLSEQEEDDLLPPKVLGKRSRQKSQTYKQAWSTSEQQLLEALLEEYPEGTKNRWKKISKAMNGKRTARQVASRVQKYFEKLKKYGID